MDDPWIRRDQRRARHQQPRHHQHLHSGSDSACNGQRTTGNGQHAVRSADDGPSPPDSVSHSACDTMHARYRYRDRYRYSIVQIPVLHSTANAHRLFLARPLLADRHECATHLPVAVIPLNVRLRFIGYQPPQSLTVEWLLRV
jgi:hypothetical protein